MQKHATNVHRFITIDLFVSTAAPPSNNMPIIQKVYQENVPLTSAALGQVKAPTINIDFYNN